MRGKECSYNKVTRDKISPKDHINTLINGLIRKRNEETVPRVNSNKLKSSRHLKRRLT